MKDGFYRLSLNSIRHGAKGYVTYFEETPVGICQLSSLMKTGGIFSVGTLREYRRRGIGTTLTVHALIESANEGNDLHTLQTVKGGDAERLYKEIGFEIDYNISYFVKKFEGEKETQFSP